VFVLLNDTQFVEAARVLAEKSLKEGGRAPEQRIRFSFRRLTAREPTRQEIALLRELLAEQQTLFAKEPDRAAKLIEVGDRKRDLTLDALDLAATTILTQTILNLDATVWKR
jgi:outer membrane PBP1 activator LpoA protein